MSEADKMKPEVVIFEFVLLPDLTKYWCVDEQASRAGIASLSEVVALSERIIILNPSLILRLYILSLLDKISS